MKVLRVILLVSGLFFSAIGLINFGVGTYFYFSTSAFLKRAITTTGSVTALQPGPSQGGTVSPTIQFTDAEGQAHSITSSISTSPPSYAIGQSVQVLYEPGHPDGAIIKSFAPIWFLTILFFGVGIMPLLFGLACLIGWRVARRVDTKQSPAPRPA
jgi:hypothetical protein